MARDYEYGLDPQSDAYQEYYDVYGPGGEADDRNDEYDPEFLPDDGYCEHGVYVGGCGADFMCGYCEDGISQSEVVAMHRAQKLRKVREDSERTQQFLNDLLREHHSTVGGMWIAEMVERSVNVCNPESRYGRHGWR